MAAAAAGGIGDGGGGGDRRGGRWWLDWADEKPETEAKEEEPEEDRPLPVAKHVENKTFSYPRGTTGNDAIDKKLKEIVDNLNSIGVMRRRIIMWLTLMEKGSVKCVPKSVSSDGKTVMILADRAENEFQEVDRHLKTIGRKTPLEFPSHFLEQPRALPDAKEENKGQKGRKRSKKHR